MLKKTEYAFLIFLLFFAAGFFFFSKNFGKVATADTPQAAQYLSGYAWSSNIGWISFRGKTQAGQDYGVNMDSGGILSGYAWSSNIGWISFGCGTTLCNDGVGMPVYPPGGTQSGPTLVGNSLVGFARACSVFLNGCSGTLKGNLDRGDWDGWISLNGTNYGVVYDSSTKKFGNSSVQSFAWGGGTEIDGNSGSITFGQNISPQSPGWIDFHPVVGGDDKDAVKLCDTADCGTPAGFSCTPSQYPIVNTPITWNVTPADSSYNYSWKLSSPNHSPAVAGTDYQFLGGDMSSPSFQLMYKISGAWRTDVVVTDSSGNPVGTGHCDTDSAKNCPIGVDGLCYTVNDKDFLLSADNSMTAQFIRSIRTVTFPDVKISVTPVADFAEDVSLSFVSIENADHVIVAGPGSNNTLLVADQIFWNDTNSTPAKTILLSKASGNYQSAMIRLNLTKNQSAGNLPLLSGNYKVWIRATSATSGIDKTYPIDLRINNPSGGVIEK